MPSETGPFDVGGVLLDRPFRIRRLAHFGLHAANVREMLRFYVELLGFRISDMLGTGAADALGPDGVEPSGHVGYFTTHGTEHHTLVIFNQWQHRARELPDLVSLNQLTWQVGSLREVRDGIDWFEGLGYQLAKAGRDMPGSNWHLYVFDQDRHRNELTYGIEQIGWNGYSKPREMYYRGFEEPPRLPQIGELAEVHEALRRGIDIFGGHRAVDPYPANHDVEGVLLPRPFKVVKLGPIGLFVADLEQALDFYAAKLGLLVTEETRYRGERCVFLRANTEHHSLALYPIGLLGTDGLSQGSTTASFGCQLASYRQLRDAARFLEARGCRVVESDAALHPGVDYAVHVVDPDGHVVQLYYWMEQIGWDGRPRPAEMRPSVQPGEWPETVPAHPDTYQGEVYLGPWG